MSALLGEGEVKGPFVLLQQLSGFAHIRPPEIEHH
jgi:hypothetical protein